MPGPHPGIRSSIAAGLLAVAACGFISSNWLGATPQPGAAPKSPASKPLSADLFRDGPANRKPDMVLVLSGQQHSYLKFCGCTPKQLGGFERRYNFVMKLRERGWPVVAADLGDLVWYQSGIHEQALLKYKAAMSSLEAIGYAAIGLGEHDYKLPLQDSLPQYMSARKVPFPPRVLAANLKDAAIQFPFDDKYGMIGDAVLVPSAKGSPSVGITSLAGPGVMARSASPLNGIQFEDFDKSLKAMVQKLDANKAEIKVLLLQGPDEQAKKLAGQFDVILCLCDEEEPPNSAQVVGRTTIVRVGHRGRHIGVVGLYRTGDPQKPFDARYQRVAMDDELETDTDKEAQNPILKILDDYAREVRALDLVSKTEQRKHPVALKLPKQKVAFAGSEQCKKCHMLDYAVWEREIPTSKHRMSHSKAFTALTRYATKPRLRQFDPECVVCHVVGYGFETGYRNEKTTASLKNVGCENCHGPASHHVADHLNKDFYPSLSPWKSAPGDALPSPERLQLGYDKLTPAEQKIVLNVNELCQKCHDVDNDPLFKFEKYWPKIVHGRGKTPK